MAGSEPVVTRVPVAVMDPVIAFRKPRAASSGDVLLDGNGYQLISGEGSVLDYQGTWNADTNTPTLVSGDGLSCEYYIVSVAGSTELDGISTWNVGDWVVSNGTTWQRVEYAATAVAMVSTYAVVSIDDTDSPYTASYGELVLCDATSGAIVVNLPAAASNAGKQINVKKIDSSENTVTVDGNGSETVDGQATQVLSAQYENITTVSDGTNMVII